MQEQHNINAEKITKPIQLLAAWLIGLIVLVGSLITAAATVKEPNWLPVFFAISSVSIIPVFLLLIFLLQTKFRPEMQEDSFYSKYLEKDTMTYKTIDRENVKAFEIDNIKKEILLVSESTKGELKKIQETLLAEKNHGKQKDKVNLLIEKSDLNLDHLKKIVRLSNVKLNINTKLSTYNAVLEAIKKIGFAQYDEFGEEDMKLEHFVLSFGGKIPIEMVKQLIFGLIPCGAQYIKIANKDIESNDNQVFIGSYAFNPQCILIDESLINELEKAKSISFDSFFLHFATKQL